MIRYYILLFKEAERDEFKRDELVDFPKLIPKSILDLFEINGNMPYFLIVYFLVSILVYSYSLLGGIIGGPHYTNEFGNYFFLAPFLFLAITFGYSILIKAILPRLEYETPTDILGQLLSQTGSIILSAGLSTIAMNFAVYGAYQQISFFFVLFNTFLIFAILIWKLCKPNNPEEKYREDDEVEYYSDPDWENDQMIA